MYLYGEIKIHSSSEVKIEDNCETKEVIVGNGKKRETVFLWREIGDDVWYDTNSNEARISIKKRKIIKSHSLYD